MAKNLFPKIVRGEKDVPLFSDVDLGPPIDLIEIEQIRHPVWTENKARLIQHYLVYFVYITKHGTYIDGFAGPQEPDKPEMWAAKLVLENEPRWLRHFHLYDLDAQKVQQLETLASQQPTHDSKGKKIGREITTSCGDFNDLVLKLLEGGTIAAKEATFCLLDQRTFECKWSTVEALARYKPSGENKIEIFYFLPNSWQDRALAGLTANPQNAADWWGEPITPQALKDLGQKQRCDILVAKFKGLGYKSVLPWPIFERPNKGGCIMYYMIHATDHPEAPKQMRRAYSNAVGEIELVEQLKLF